MSCLKEPALTDACFDFGVLSRGTTHIRMPAAINALMRRAQWASSLAMIARNVNAIFEINIKSYHTWED